MPACEWVCAFCFRNRRDASMETGNGGLALAIYTAQFAASAGLSPIWPAVARGASPADRLAENRAQLRSHVRGHTIRLSPLNLTIPPMNDELSGGLLRHSSTALDRFPLGRVNEYGIAPIKGHRPPTSPWNYVDHLSHRSFHIADRCDEHSGRAGRRAWRTEANGNTHKRSRPCCERDREFAAPTQAACRERKRRAFACMIETTSTASMKFSYSASSAGVKAPSLAFRRNSSTRASTSASARRESSAAADSGVRVSVNGSSNRSR